MYTCLQKVYIVTTTTTVARAPCPQGETGSGTQCYLNRNRTIANQEMARESLCYGQLQNLMYELAMGKGPFTISKQTIAWSIAAGHPWAGMVAKVVRLAPANSQSFGNEVFAIGNLCIQDNVT
jgi:hypothetical protein